MSLYMMSVRKLKKKDETRVFCDESGPTQFLICDGSQCDGEQVVARKEWLQSLLSELTSLSGEGPRHLVVYMHPHRSSAQDALGQQRALQRQLQNQGFTGVVVGFDWPAPAGALMHWEDRDTAIQAAQRLRDDCISLLCAQQQQNCTVQIHALAHGSSAYVLREAMRLADEKSSLKKKQWRLAHVALIAADVSARSLRTGASQSRSLMRHSQSVCNYYNPCDATLSVVDSNLPSLSERAGRVAVQTEGHEGSLLNINCEAQYALLDGDTHSDNPQQCADFSHQWYIYNEVFAQDFVAAINGDVDGRYISTRQEIYGALSLYSNESIILLEDD